MTSAFTIWLAAAVGMTFGAGYAGAASGLVLLTWVILTVVRRTKHGDSGGACESIVSIVLNPDHGKASIKMNHLLAEFPLPADRSDAARAIMSGNNGQSITDYRNEINRSFWPHSRCCRRSSPSSGGLQDRQEPSTAEEIEPWFPPEG